MKKKKEEETGQGKEMYNELIEKGEEEKVLENEEAEVYDGDGRRKARGEVEVKK